MGDMKSRNKKNLRGKRLLRILKGPLKIPMIRGKITTGREVSSIKGKATTRAIIFTKQLSKSK